MSARASASARANAGFVAVAAVTAQLVACRATPSHHQLKARGASADGPNAVAVSALQLDGSRWLARDAEIARALGAGPLQVAVTQMAGDGDRVGGFVDIPSDQCLLAYARGSPSVEDLDIYAYTDEGTTLAADEATDPAPAVLFCPPHPTRAYLMARVVAGRGVVSIGVHGLLPSAAAQVGRALGARGRPGEELGRVEAWPGLDERIGHHRRAIGSQWEEVRRVAVQADARAPTRLAATVEAGRCLDVLVLAGEEFAQLDVTILDAEDRILLRAPAIGRDRAAIVCSAEKSALSIELRPHAGQGLCAVMLARSAVGAEAQIAAPVHVIRPAPEAELHAEQKARDDVLSSAGYGRAVRVGGATAEVGRRISFPVGLPDGCVRLDVVGGRPVAGLSADLWSSANALIASGSSGLGPALFACGRASAARLDVEALSRAGPFAVEMRREPTADRLLTGRPLAAGRLLAAAQRPSRVVPAAACGPIRAVSLDDASFRSVDWVLPPHRCANLIAALDAGGSGLELHVAESPPAAAPLTSRGSFVTTGHVCADNRPRALHAELRLRQGKADALVALVLEPVLSP